MEPAMLPGDIILVSKMTYGVRLLNPVIYFKQKKIEYFRTRGWSSIKKGDTFVFNWPEFKKSTDSSTDIYGDCLVKRCYTLPEDTVIIKNERIINEKNNYGGEIYEPGMGDIQRKHNLFPRDSSLRWSLDKYGPLYVPGRGQTINLTKQIVYWYKDILLYENPNARIKDSTLVIDGKTVLKYTFQHNYYFMLGDNFYNSYDSRYWGFLPDANVIGKAIVVLFSIDPYENGLKKIRWRRFFKLI